MKNNIFPCIWYDTQAAHAATLYIEAFDNAEITGGNSMVTTLTIGGMKLMLLNGGPSFRPNPTMSFYVTCDTVEEVTRAYDTLLVKGRYLMPLNKYPWSEWYGWVEDQYGVSWQITKGNVQEIGQKLLPALMFTGEQFGKGKEAIAHYSSIFKDAETHFIANHLDQDELHAGKIAHSQFSLSGYKLVIMDSAMSKDLTFSVANSMVVECVDQSTIDHYWNALTKEGEESQCGWLKDKYGLSWQIIPTRLGDLMSDPLRIDETVKSFMKMKKFIIAELPK